MADDEWLLWLTASPLVSTKPRSLLHLPHEPPGRESTLAGLGIPSPKDRDTADHGYPERARHSSAVSCLGGSITPTFAPQCVPASTG